MKKTILLLTASLLLYVASAQSDKCGTMQAWNQLKAKDPDAAIRMARLEEFTKQYQVQHPVQNNKINQAVNASRSQRSVISIPVIVHVIYHGEPIGTGANISDAQIYSQIEALNADFRLLNADSLPDTHPFWYYSADCQIEFCLAQQDPNGNATTGIVRINSAVDYFTNQDFYNDAMKFTSQGGDDNWDPLHYLNFWTFKLESKSNLLGKGSFPSNLAAHPELDGLLCRYDAFGTTGPDLMSTNALGRTMTHEVGHWLNLKHIWGDDDAGMVNETCDQGECDGSDEVDDTPNQCERTYGCPAFPNNPYSGCGNDGNGDMYMNYMDYTNDPCLVMFTFGQGERMQATLAGPRNEMLNSNGCQVATSISNVSSDSKNIEVSPNPGTGNFNIRFKDAGEALSKLSVVNNLGMTVANIELSNTVNYQMNLSSLPSGVYFIQSVVNGKTVSKKLILTK